MITQLSNDVNKAEVIFSSLGEAKYTAKCVYNGINSINKVEIIRVFESDVGVWSQWSEWAKW